MSMIKNAFSAVSNNKQLFNNISTIIVCGDTIINYEDLRVVTKMQVLKS